MNDDIVKYILDFLKPWKPRLHQIEAGPRAGEIVEKSDADVKLDIFEAVTIELSRLRAIAPDFLARDAIEKTRQDARDLIKVIDKLSQMLSSRTLSPELRTRLGDAELPADAAIYINNLPVPRLLDALGAVRRRCQAASENQPQADQIKFWCATKALGLMLNYSEKKPRAGSVNTPFCAIAGLLYQGITGDEQSLRGVCQSVLRPYQDLPGWHD